MHKSEVVVAVKAADNNSGRGNNPDRAAVPGNSDKGSPEVDNPEWDKGSPAADAVKAAVSNSDRDNNRDRVAVPGNSDKDSPEAGNPVWDRGNPAEDAEWDSPEVDRVDKRISPLL